MVLLPAPAVVAPAARPDPVHHGEPFEPEGRDPVADRDDGSGDLVAQGHRQGVRQGALRAVHDVEVGVAQPDGIDAQQELAGSRPGDRHLPDLRLALPRGELNGSHRPGQAHRRGSSAGVGSQTTVLDIRQKLN